LIAGDTQKDIQMQQRQLQQLKAQKLKLNNRIRSCSTC